MRMLSALLALAVLSGMAVFAADSGAADSGFRLTVLKAQTLTEEAVFDPDAAPEAESVSPGEIVVLTLGFRNDSGAAVSVAGFAVKLRYDKEKVSPYVGAAPFKRNPYQVSAELAEDYGWSTVGNGEGDGFVSATGGGSDAYSVPDGAELVLCRMAFRADAEGVAPFVLDPNSEKTNVTASDRKTLPLNALQPFDLTIGAYEIFAVETDSLAGICKVTLSNPQAVTVAASFFDADGRFAVAVAADVPPQCGSVDIPLPEALPANAVTKVALFDSDWRPLACLGAKVA